MSIRAVISVAVLAGGVPCSLPATAHSSAATDIVEYECTTNAVQGSRTSG
ncbi:hypothetical protein [Acrocarpospora corrugata]|nr:hypothetical protein [Acrocarpospora corrugata]